MSKYVVDTHALIWFFAGSERLGEKAKAAMSDPDNTLVLPAIVLSEACWVIALGRTAILNADILLQAVASDPRFYVEPLDFEVIQRAQALTSIGEMHDGQIVATALLANDDGGNVPLITCDKNIIKSGLVSTIW